MLSWLNEEIFIWADNKALHLTAIPLRSIAAGELQRYLTELIS
jgi:hypothetical protein